MTTVETRLDPFLDGLLASAAKGATAPPAVASLRAAAVTALKGLRLPTAQDEEWRATSLKALTALSLEALSPLPRICGVLLAQITRFLVPEAQGRRLVFVDGVFAPALSSIAALPAGLVVAPLALALAGHSQDAEDLLARHLGSLATIETDIFAALNTAFLGEGSLVAIAPGLNAGAPIQLLHVSTGATGLARSPANFPRCLIVAGRGSELTVIQEFVSVGEGAYFTDTVSEVVVGENAAVCHVLVQSESRAAVHIGRTAVGLAKDSRYALQAISLGASLSRLNLDVLQQGEGSEAIVDGLALVAGTQETDTHSVLDHARPHGRSEQRHKVIVDDQAHAVFNGRIIVRPGAQLTDSSQSSRSLLLSPKGRVDTKPELMIFADDVKCAHGAAIGQIDPEALFYLRSRGLCETAARDLLTYAFAAEVIAKVPVASLKKQLQAVVLGRTHRNGGGQGA